MVVAYAEICCEVKGLIFFIKSDRDTIILGGQMACTLKNFLTITLKFKLFCAF